MKWSSDFLIGTPGMDKTWYQATELDPYFQFSPIWKQSSKEIISVTGLPAKEKLTQSQAVDDRKQN